MITSSLSLSIKHPRGQSSESTSSSPSLLKVPFNASFVQFRVCLVLTHTGVVGARLGVRSVGSNNEPNAVLAGAGRAVKPASSAEVWIDSMHGWLACLGLLRPLHPQLDRPLLLIYSF